MNETNRLQRLVQSLVMRPGITRSLSKIVAKIDQPLLRLSRGYFSASGFLAGWPVIVLTTTGARSDSQRATPLIGILHDDQVILIASNFGKAAHPAWYYNLKAHPTAKVTYRGRTSAYRARQAEGDELERCWALAYSTYRGYAAYQDRANRTIPVIILEPVILD